MSDFYIERLCNLLKSFKNDQNLINNIKGINELNETIKQSTLINLTIFLYNNGNLSPSEKAEILSSIRDVCKSFIYNKTKRR